MPRRAAPPPAPPAASAGLLGHAPRQLWGGVDDVTQRCHAARGCVLQVDALRGVTSSHRGDERWQRPRLLGHAPRQLWAFRGQL